MMPDDSSLRHLAEPPEASYEAVRRRVMGEIRRRRRVRDAARILAAVAACVVVAVAWMLAVQHEAPLPGLPVLARAPEAPVAAIPVHVAHNRAKSRRSAGSLVAHAPAQPLVVRMQTDDPNVVILWMVD